MTSIDNKVIAEIAQKSPTAEAFFTYAADRERNVRDGVSRLPSIRIQMSHEGFHPVPQDLISMFKDLEKAGVGILQGKQFKWNTSIKDIGQIGIADRVKPVKLPEPKPEPKQTAIPVSKKTLVVYFDNNKEVSLTFTPGLSKKDIQFVMEKLLTELS